MRCFGFKIHRAHIVGSGPLHGMRCLREELRRKCIERAGGCGCANAVIRGKTPWDRTGTAVVLRRSVSRNHSNTN